MAEKLEMCGGAATTSIRWQHRPIGGVDPVAAEGGHGGGVCATTGERSGAQAAGVRVGAEGVEDGKARGATD
jgi:hypothetical protein